MVQEQTNDRLRSRASDVLTKTGMRNRHRSRWASANIVWFLSFTQTRIALRVLQLNDRMGPRIQLETTPKALNTPSIHGSTTAPITVL